MKGIFKKKRANVAMLRVEQRDGKPFRDGIAGLRVSLAAMAGPWSDLSWQTAIPQTHTQCMVYIYLYLPTFSLHYTICLMVNVGK